MENSDIHILIVDDNRENLKVVSSYLKEKNYRLALALDGKSALKILEENKIDLILLDIMMPEMDGFEVCKIIKQNTAIKDLPIIFLTAKTDSDDIVKKFQMGGVDYITKPFKKEELYARVRNHLQLKLIRDILYYRIEESQHSNSFLLKIIYDLTQIIEHNK